MQIPSRSTSRENWWLLVASGVVSILFGLVAVFWPGITLMVLVWLFGIYALVFGVVHLVGMFRAISRHRSWWPHLLIGVFSILAAIAVFVWPLLTAAMLLFIIAFWALFVGVAEIIAGLFEPDFLLMVAGVISVVFGFILLANPAAGALALVMVIGIFAIVRGILEIISAFGAPRATATPI